LGVLLSSHTGDGSGTRLLEEMTDLQLSQAGRYKRILRQGLPHKYRYRLQ
jgi:hypothetical protein